MARVAANVRVPIAGTVVPFPLEYQNALRMAYAMKVKTLDLMHLVYADSLRRLGYDLEVFVTSDPDIHRSSKNIEKHLGIEVLEPSHQTCPLLISCGDWKT